MRILQCLKHPFLLRYQHTGKDLFVTHRVFLQPIRYHVIDILDEDDVCVLLIQVLDQRTVTSRTEEQLTVLRSKRRTVRISGDRIGAR